ncbi:MAG TPA: hypothetical protein EYP18_05420, partial [Desulfobacterales bacterium]|nr:hypothetical protein [Desulfobacterales bacterium]
LLHFVLESYQKKEFPCLIQQFEEWRENKPLSGIKVFDGAPVFKNTCAKYASLVAAGAELTVGVTDNFFYDKEVYSRLPEFGIKTVKNEYQGGDYDLVLDCAGLHHKKTPVKGFAELTRSGVGVYRNGSLPCLSVDDSRTKLLEDFLGTGDGFLRGLRSCGFEDVAKMSVLVFGFGKVGKGICMRMRQAGASVTAVDDMSRVKSILDIYLIDMNDVSAVTEAVNGADCVVTATGVAGALEGRYPEEIFFRDGLVLANMGVEDEFGGEIDDELVLAGNKPLNFLLDEPTRMNFIDPVMALHNEAAIYLLHNDCEPGLFPTPSELDSKFMEITRRAGEIAEDIKLLDMAMGEWDDKCTD